MLNLDGRPGQNVCPRVLAANRSQGPVVRGRHRGRSAAGGRRTAWRPRGQLRTSPPRRLATSLGGRSALCPASMCKSASATLSLPSTTAGPAGSPMSSCRRCRPCRASFTLLTLLHTLQPAREAHLALSLARGPWDESTDPRCRTLQSMSNGGCGCAVLRGPAVRRRGEVRFAIGEGMSDRDSVRWRWCWPDAPSRVWFRPFPARDGAARPGVW